ncbi:MAG: RNA polymerase sigma factor [Paludibacteraceae bacterium]|nr:RNA polymerase sigma factor [Paludibacteraceae bacterium]
MPQKEIDDQELIAKLQNEATRRSAFNVLVTQYQKRLYWQVRKMGISHDDTDDILQNAFIKAWTNIDKFRGESSLMTWLYRIATNETLDFLSSAHAKHTAANTDLNDVLATEIHNDVYFDGDEAQRKLKAAIEQLPEKQRIVFNLRYYDEMPYNQMSEVLGTSEGALKASYHHAVKKIEEFVLSVN